ncbi:hypothetical protein ACLB2K_071886 [Fragaria x ananassa]
MASLYVKAVPPADLNRNTEWFMYPGVWTTYILILFFSWLLVLSIFGCSPGMAWTIVNLSHFLVTYQFFHWKKGTPFAEDQGIYNGLTWWEQMDNGKQLTRNRKFLTVVPVVLYLISSHTTDYQHPMLFLNTLAVIVLVIAKFPNMHKVQKDKNVKPKGKRYKNLACRKRLPRKGKQQQKAKEVDKVKKPRCEHKFCQFRCNMLAFEEVFTKVCKDLEDGRPHTNSGCVVLIPYWICERSTVLCEIDGRCGMTPCCVKWSLPALTTAFKKIKVHQIDIDNVEDETNAKDNEQQGDDDFMNHPPKHAAAKPKRKKRQRAEEKKTSSSQATAVLATVLSARSRGK